MAIALIEELSDRLRTSPGILSYFFCENTSSSLDNAISVLRGLIYMLTEENTFVTPLKKEFRKAGPKIFENFYDLRGLLLTMLEIPYNGTIYLVVDALDECDTQLSDLLSLIANDKFASPSRVKWLITSRHREDIERKLGIKNPCVSLEEEVNSSRVSCAVESHIHIKVQELVQGHEYEDVREEFSSYLKGNAEGTFLWVALACKMVEDVLPYKLILALKKIPQGLDSYDGSNPEFEGLR